MTQYVALLRGINVGGNNIIKMADLAEFFRSQGFADVRTYIQSGNVLFRAEEDGAPSRLTEMLEEGLSKAFGYTSRLVLRSRKELRAIVQNAPEKFGEEPEVYRYDVIFLKEPLTVSEALNGITPREGVDQLFGGKGVLYTTRLIARASQSHMSKMVGMPMYQNMTIRNWNTTTKLLRMMEGVEHP